MKDDLEVKLGNGQSLYYWQFTDRIVTDTVITYKPWWRGSGMTITERVKFVKRNVPYGVFPSNPEV